MSVQVITSESFGEFLTRYDAGMADFVPMLPFVENQYHNWAAYRSFSEDGVFLLDDLDGEHCIYHLAKGPDALSLRLVLPSSWPKRAAIAAKSFGNLVRWFRQASPAGRLLVQVAEYAEFIANPTLSHYLIPAIIASGFDCRYMMYMRRENHLPIPDDIELPEQFERAGYGDDMLDEMIEFYGGDLPGYFINGTAEEVRAFAQPNSPAYELFAKSAIFIRDAGGAIATGVFATPKHDNVIYPGAFWIENFAVRPDCRGRGLGQFVLNELVKTLADLHPGKDSYAYVRRGRREAVGDYEAMNFVPFEFWMDARITV